MKPTLNYIDKKSAGLSHNSLTGLQQPLQTLWISLRNTRKLHLFVGCPLFSFRCCSSSGKIEQIKCLCTEEHVAKIVIIIDSVELKFHNSYFLMHNFRLFDAFLVKILVFCSLNQENMGRKGKNMGKYMPKG